MALPVVDAEGYLLGVVKPDEILGALQQQAFADLQKMVGVGEDERALSPVSMVVRMRLPWLYVNLATAFAAAGLSGAAIPLILRALGRDPARSASIFLTTVTDVVGFAAFLGFAVLFMPYLI